jgi:uncharacterized protein (TIGR00255 family)
MTSSGAKAYERAQPMRSMTGFGLGDAPYAQGRVVVEARSVNHRYLDVRVRVPAEVADHAFYVEQVARQRLERGRLDISVQLEGTSGGLAFDRERARTLYAELLALRDELAPGTELPISALAAFGTLLAPSASHDADTFRGAVEQALDSALVALAAMRSKEGLELRRDLAARLEAVAQIAEKLSERAPLAVNTHVARLRDRIARLLEGTGIELDPGRLENEIALMADRGDIAEEVVRLRSHVDQVRALLASNEPVGKRLDFLVQEMGREANTIGAKSQDAPSSHLAVELKAELSRIREQVQNVE